MSDEWETLPWLAAIMAADTITNLGVPVGDPFRNQRSDLAPLVNLLRSTTPLPEDARELLADLLDRHQLKRRSGGRRTPAYLVSPAELTLLCAAEDFHGQWPPHGWRPGDGHTASLRDDVVTRVAEYWDIQPSTLHNFLDGKRGSTRRRQRRARPQA